MNNGSDGKEPDWAKVDLDRSTAQERLLYGSAIRGLRLAHDMTQAEVADAANVSARTVRNIEKGEVAAQPAVLKRILIALDVQPGGGRLRASTEGWLAVLGPLIDTFSDERQTDVMQRTIRFLTGHMTTDETARPVVALHPAASNDGGLSDDEIRSLDFTDLATVAGTDETTDSEDDSTP